MNSDRSATRLNAESLEAGFHRRASQARSRTVPDASAAAASPEALPAHQGSLFEVFSGRLNRHAAQAAMNDRQKNRWLLISAALSSPRVETQLKLLDAVSPAEDINFNVSYAVGSSFSDKILSESELSQLSDEDVSVLLESYMRFRPDALEGLAPHLVAEIRHYSRKFWDDIEPSKNARAVDALDDLACRIGKWLDTNKEGTLGGLRNTVAVGKRRVLHLFGPDLFSILQALLDPSMRLDSTLLAASSQLFEEIGLRDLFAKLLVIRIIGEYPEEQKFLRDNYSNLLRPLLADRQLGMVIKVLRHERDIHPVRSASSGWLRRLVYILTRIAAAQAHGNPRPLVDGIIDLYELDKDLVHFLNWNPIHAVLSTAPPSANARTVFVTLLMNDPGVRDRYPEVYFGMGMGAFIGDLTALIDQRRTKDPVSYLLQKCKELPSQSGRFLTSSILERSVIERLVSELPAVKRWPNELPPINETKLSIARINALRDAGVARLLPTAEIEEQTNAEIDRLRMEYFESRRRTGRVNIAWDVIQKGMRPLMETEAPVLKALSMNGSGPPISNSIFQQLCTMLASRLTNFILFRSEASIDQAISNNLRHGIILPRFLRAFDDAYQTAVMRRDLPSWDESTIRTNFGDDTEDLITLRDGVSDRIKMFLEENLTFSEGGEFEEAVREAISRKLIHSYSSPRSSNPKPDASLSKEVERQTRVFLATASRQLGDVIQKEVSAELKLLRQKVRRRSHPLTNSFIDHVETNLHAAFSEVRQWTGMTTEKTNLIPFRASEVVQLHLISTALFSADKLKVDVKVRRNGSSEATVPEPRFTGKYLEMFEVIVHNLFSNAFLYSGEGLKTRVWFSVEVSAKHLKLSCLNSFSVAKLTEVAQQHASTVAQARSKEVELARKDSASGFQKMRAAVARATSKQPRFHIPVPDTRSRFYKVDVLIPVATLPDLEPS